jgi:hypothetical protein
MKHLFLLVFLHSNLFSFAQKDKIISDENAKIRSIAPFNAVLVGGAFTVHYSKGDSFQLAVSASNENLRDHIVTKVIDGELQISLESSSWKSWRGQGNYTVYISSPKLNRIIASGAVNFDVHDTLKTDELQLRFSGASDFSGNIQSQKMNAVFSGGSDIKAQGKVENLSMVMSGASDCKCFSLISENLDIVTSGASNVQITVNKTLKAVASGASDIIYAGSPVAEQTKSSGASRIVKRG